MSVFREFDELLEFDRSMRWLLQAVLLDAPRDRECCERWLEGVDVEALGAPALRLLPALYAKFGVAMASHPRAERLRVAYRYWRFRSRRLLADARGAIERLRGADVEVLLFKGIATTLLYHRDAALRAMGDVDVLVHSGDVERSERLLRGSGWRPLHAPPHAGLADTHSRDLVNARRSGFDLHWFALSESRREDIDAGLWSRARAFDWDGLPVKVMAPEDLLLVCLVGAMRDAGPMRLHWLQDVAAILRTEAALDWTTVWQEAGRRGLRLRVFEALNLARAVAGTGVTETLLHRWVDADAELRRELLAAAVAEGRTFGLDRARQREIEAIAGDPAVPSPGAPRHVRVFTSADGAITRLYLRYQHLSRLAELFDIDDPQRLDAWVAAQPAQGEGLVDVPPGLLTVRSQVALGEYGAQIVVRDGAQAIELLPGTTGHVALEVENCSTCCWPVGPGSEARFGVGYHLLGSDGQVIPGDLTRAVLVQQRKGYVAFIEPGQKLACELAIQAPTRPGTYRVQLDLAHEGVRWFSDARFPQIELRDPGPRPSGWFAASDAGVILEMREGETCIVDLAGGRRFITAGYGPAIWSALMQGHGTVAIVVALAQAGISDAYGAVVAPFLRALLAEGLVVPRAPIAPPHGPLRLAWLPGPACAPLQRCAAETV